MTKIFKNKLNRNIKYLLTVISLAAGLFACKEQNRFEIGYNDSEPPSAPEYLRYEPLFGGAKLFYKIPPDEDLLSIDASYTNMNGDIVWFSVSYFSDSISVYGFSDSLEHVINLYAVDRAGNRSEIVPVTVTPLEPAYMRTVRTTSAVAGFSSFYIDWVNELEQNINVYVNFSYTRQGEYREHTLISTSMNDSVRWFIRDLADIYEPVRVKVRVEDMYGNITDYYDKGEIVLLHDEIIPKDKWFLPNYSDTVGGVPMAFLQYGEARKEYVIDGIIDDSENVNYIHTGGNGRTGYPGDGNAPWNIMIDLGDEYEISRIVTHQRYYTGTYPTTGRGQYYGPENVAIYATYIWNADEEAWERVMQNKISIPVFATQVEYMHAGREGDMAYLYPEDPKFTKPTRWFRYEALFGYSSNYTEGWNMNCLSEITLYGRKAGTN
ncbi:MAG: DUF4959 domain-containing protein [Prevotellaceae bacterium]|jgi:hypothetical protein|nr:DUF4959 domain-containing protein [Prevotellaceae bacterium]